MTRWLLLPLALLLIAASPHHRGKRLSLAVPHDPTPLVPASPSPLRLTPKPGPDYEPAPLPNRDVSGPVAPRASTAPSFAPSLFTTRNQYRGDGFAPNSTAQAEQEKRLRPGAGFSLHMPFTDR